MSEKIRVEPSFKRRLSNLINEFSLENKSSTPDFILSNYLIRCLDNFDETSDEKSSWFSDEKQPTTEAETAR